MLLNWLIQYIPVTWLLWIPGFKWFYPVVYISGKGGTGKSTLAKKFQNHGYHMVSLDEVIRGHVHQQHSDISISQLFSLYRPDSIPMVQPAKDTFKTMVQDLITQQPIVVEGTIKDNQLIQDIFPSKFLFLCTVPKTPQAYGAMIWARYQADPTEYGRLGFLKKAAHGNPATEALAQAVGQMEYTKITDLLQHYQQMFQVIQVNT